MKKIFTLFNLLIVLIILAIASLFLTPYALEKINEAKIKQLESTSILYIEQLERNNIGEEFMYKPGFYDIELTSNLLRNDNPTDGWVIVGYDGKIEAGIFKYNNILTKEMTVYYNNEIKTIRLKDSYINPKEITTDSLTDILNEVYDDVNIEAIIE